MASGSTPSRARAASGSCCTSHPSTDAVPPSGLTIPVIARSAVVLPAPLGPSRPVTTPFGAANETPNVPDVSDAPGASDEPITAPEPPRSCNDGVSFDDLFASVAEDLRAEGDDGIFLRYISLGNRLNQGICAEDLQQDRFALIKALNSLSTEVSIALPRAWSLPEAVERTVPGGRLGAFVFSAVPDPEAHAVKLTRRFVIGEHGEVDVEPRDYGKLVELHAAVHELDGTALLLEPGSDG